MNNQDLYKQIPSVDEIINNLPADFLLIPRNLLKKIIRNSIKEVKTDISNKKTDKKIKIVLDNLISKRLLKVSRPHFDKVINGTGIILHTGLGRAPISKEIFTKALNSTYPYANLEFNNKIAASNQIKLNY